MAKLLARLRETPLLVADGAWGTMFIDAGLDPAREPADAWNLRHPDRIAQLASAYAAHADVLTTNTFGANAIRLGALGLEAELWNINATGVAMAREAVSRIARPMLVGGAMGPARGPVRPDNPRIPLDRVYETQALCLAEAGVDFLLLETMTDLVEATIAIRATRSVCDLEVVCSFAFHEAEPGRYRTWSGDTVEAALDTATESGAAMVGANCIPALKTTLPLLQAMRSSMGNAPLWFKPNAGQPQRSGTGATRARYPHPFAQAPLAAFLRTLETGVIGGCCGAAPFDIAVLRALVDRYPTLPTA